MSCDERKPKASKEKISSLKHFKMRNHKAGWLLVALFFLAGVAGFAFLNKREGTNITVSENKNTISVSAEFPDEKSKQVQADIRSQLNLSDLPDLSYVEIQQYQTPDRLMRFYIKSRPGYLEFRMDKSENNTDAYAKMKNSGEVIKKALAN
jgi:hypothetical protein